MLTVCSNDGTPAERQNPERNVTNLWSINSLAFILHQQTFSTTQHWQKWIWKEARKLARKAIVAPHCVYLYQYVATVVAIHGMESLGSYLGPLWLQVLQGAREHQTKAKVESGEEGGFTRNYSRATKIWQQKTRHTSTYFPGRSPVVQKIRQQTYFS